MILTSDKELDLLEFIARNRTRVRQRDLAKVIGLSLGMTNAILKRLAQKGWLTMKKVNNRNIRYIVSPQGMEKIARRTYRYFRRTIKNVAYYREVIEQFVRKAKREGYTSIILVGKSDLDFIVEHACLNNKLRYSCIDLFDPIGSDRDGAFFLFSENAGDTETQKANSASLSKLLIAR